MRKNFRKCILLVLIMFVMGCGNNESVSLLDEFFKAIENGDYESVESILEANPEILYDRDKVNRTPLHVAAGHGRLEIAELLLKKGVDVNARIPDVRWTPLHMAVNNWEKQMVEFLIKNGADVNARDQFENTPLHLKAMSSHNVDGILEVLLSNGADVSTRDNQGSTPLHEAAECNLGIDGPLRAIKLLVEYGADINAPDNWNITPLGRAIGRNDVERCELIYSLGGRLRNGNTGEIVEWSEDVKFNAGEVEIEVKDGKMIFRKARKQ